MFVIEGVEEAEEREEEDQVSRHKRVIWDIWRRKGRVVIREEKQRANSRSQTDRERVDVQFGGMASAAREEAVGFWAPWLPRRMEIPQDSQAGTGQDRRRQADQDQLTPAGGAWRRWRLAFANGQIKPRLHGARKGGSSR